MTLTASSPPENHGFYRYFSLFFLHSPAFYAVLNLDYFAHIMPLLIPAQKLQKIDLQILPVGEEKWM